MIQVLVFLLLVLTPVFSQDPTEEATENPNEVIEDNFASGEDNLVKEEEVIKASPDVATTTAFPRYGDARLPVGKVIEILVGFQNNGHKTFNLTSIHGSYRYPGDLSIFIQNFTSWKHGALVKPGDLRTFAYRFFPDQLLEPREYILVATVAYNDEDNVNYTSTVYNGTIAMVEAALPVDAQTFFAYFLGVGLVALLSFGAYTYFLGGKKKRTTTSTATKTAVETGTRDTSANNNEWTKDLHWKKSKESSTKKKPAS